MGKKPARKRTRGRLIKPGPWAPQDGCLQALPLGWRSLEGGDRPPSPWVPGAAHTLTPNLLLASPEPPVGPRRVARQWYPVATTAAHAGTGALLREEQDQFLQREYFALLISAAAGCRRLSQAAGVGTDPGEALPGLGGRPRRPCRVVQTPGRWLPLPAPVGEACRAWRGPGAAQGAPCKGPQAHALLPPWGPGHLGFLLGQRCCRESECGQCWALSAPWCSTQGGVPPLGPRALAAAPRRASLPHSAGRDRWSALCPSSPPGPPSCPPVLRGVALACYTDPLSFAFSCFPRCPVTLWETGRQDWPGPERGGRSWVWKGAADAGS